MEKETAVVTLQAALRGFHVRQCQPLQRLRQIADVRTKLKKLNTRACDPTYIDKLCSDPMENRKMKEEIMALLLELDTIQGLLPVVRNIRKSVTRDVVEFQEIVDGVKVDPVARSEVEEVNHRPSGEINSRGSESVNPPLRRVVSLDDNLYPEQSHALPANKKKPSDGAAGDGSNRSSDEDAAPRRRQEGWIKSPALHRSTSGLQRPTVNKGPSLARTSSEVVGLRNHLLGRSISEVLRKPMNKSPLLGRSISEVQRKKKDVLSPPVTIVPDGHRSPHPKTPPLAGDRVSSWEGSSSPGRQNMISFNREQAAVRIQSRFRGHLSRRSRPLKHLRNISVVNTRLTELNLQLADPICAERLRSDEMERLKWSEEITALLLKLDSVQGVVQAVRDIRKSVTREVIKLQEKVDAIIHEADILSRIAVIQNVASVAGTEQIKFGPEISDHESVDNDRGKQVVDSSSKASASFAMNVEKGGVQAQQDSHLWDDKFMDSQKPLNFEQDCDGSTASCPLEKGNNDGELRPEQPRVQRKLKRILSGSVESRFTDSQNAFEIQQSDTLSSGRFPTEHSRSLIMSSVSAAGTETEGKQQPLLHDGEVDCEHSLLARTQKKLKRIEKEILQTGTISGAVNLPDTTATSYQDQLTRYPSGNLENPVEAVMGGVTEGEELPSDGISTAVGYRHHTYSRLVVPSMRTSNESLPSQRHMDGGSNDVLKQPDGEFHSDREQQGCYNGRSSPEDLPCGHHPEERACEFLRSRAGHAEELGSGFSKVSNGRIAQEDRLPITSEAPAVHRPSQVQWEVDRLSALMDENARLKLLLSQVLEHAEGQAHDLQVTKRRLGILEKERVQHTKKEDSGLRKKTAFARRRR